MHAASTRADPGGMERATNVRDATVVLHWYTDATGRPAGYLETNAGAQVIFDGWLSLHAALWQLLPTDPAASGS